VPSERGNDRLVSNGDAHLIARDAIGKTRDVSGKSAHAIGETRDVTGKSARVIGETRGATGKSADVARRILLHERLT